MLRLLAAAPILGVAFAAIVVCEARPASTATLATALDSTAFVDSVGVNVHFSYDDGPYGKREAVAQLIRDLGVTHLRDGLTAGRTDVCRIDRSLAEHGVRFMYVTQPHPTLRRLREWAECVGASIEAYEGVNEYDISHPWTERDWIGTLRASQNELYCAVKSDRALAHLVVVGPSVTSAAAARSLGDLSASLDEGNTHDYFAGREPETVGWGSDGYGSIGFNLALAKVISRQKSVIATESGFGTQPSPADPQSMDEATQAVYVPRLFLAQSAAGLLRTYQYELIDEGPPPFSAFGLVRSDLTPKPAFRALASLLRELRGKRHMVNGALPLEVEGAPADARRLLFLRADGTYVLALWRASAGWDPHVGRSLLVGDAPIMLRVGVPIESARVVAIDADGDLRPGPTRERGSDVSLRIGPRVAFVEIRITRAARPSPMAGAQPFRSRRVRLPIVNHSRVNAEGVPDRAFG